MDYVRTTIRLSNAVQPTNDIPLMSVALFIFCRKFLQLLTCVVWTWIQVVFKIYHDTIVQQDLLYNFWLCDSYFV